MAYQKGLELNYNKDQIFRFWEQHDKIRRMEIVQRMDILFAIGFI